MDADLNGARRYMDAVRAILDSIEAHEQDAISRAGSVVADAVRAGRVVYLFGTGHSHMLAEEGHYRAGGLAPVVPILNTGLMLHENAVISTRLERLPGLGPIVLERYDVQPGDVLFVFSNSGVNAAPVETALAAHEQGLTVIAVVSLDYSRMAPVGPTGQKLIDVADIVIDNHGIPGDAVVEVGDTGQKTGATSTVAGAFILNAVLSEAVSCLAQDGETPPIYVSANMPGAQAHNQALFDRYRPRNPHL